MQNVILFWVGVSFGEREIVVKGKKKDTSQTPKVVFLAKITILHSLLTTCAKSIEINANIFNFREFGGRVFLSAVMYIYMTVVKGK